MKSCKFVLSIVVALFFNCCSNKISDRVEYIEPVFEKVIDVEANILNNKFLFSVGKIGIVDSLIVYSGMTDVSDKAFHLFSKNTGKYLLSFGNIGRAKGELSSPSLSFSFNKEKKLIYVFDPSFRKIVTYSLENVLVGDYTYMNEIELPMIIDNVSTNRLFYNNDLFLAGYSRSGRFLICTGNDSISCSDFYPSLDEPEQYKKVERQYYFYLGCMSVKPDGKMFVHATRSGCIMEIWRNEGLSISPYIIKGLFKPNYNSFYRDMNYPRVTPSENAPYGISSLSCSDKFIYAVFDNNPCQIASKIAVFDWKGNPKKLYNVNKSFISIDVDDDNAVFALVQNNKEGNYELVTIPLQ